MKRLEYGATKNMTDEEKRQHRRDLQRRWRKNHPDFIKMQNKHFYEFYSRVKPYICICVKCGQKFYKSRKYYKFCPECLENMHKTADLRRKAIVLKQEERQQEYKEIVDMYKNGHSQQIIAETFGRSQSGVSQIIRRLKLKKQ